MQTETDRLLQGFALASTHLMTIPDGQASVQAGLGALGSALEVDRVYIFEHHPHPQTGEWAASQRWEWVNEGVTPQIDHPALQNCPFADFFPRWFPILTQGQPIGVLIKDFPDNEQAILAPQGILSMLVVPIFIQDRCWGFVGFDDCHHERVWESSIQAALKSFAGTLGSAIARWKAEANAKELAARLQAAQRIAHIGNWELNLQDNALYWSEEVFRIFEVDPQQFGASYEAFLGLVHPEDRPLVEAAYGKHVSDRQPYELVYRLQMPDGRIKYVREQCETTYDAGGTPLLSQGTVQDITEQKEAELRRERAEAAIRKVVEGTAAVTGEHFFQNLVLYLADVLQVRYALVTELVDRQLQSLGFCVAGELQPQLSYLVAKTPCEKALQDGEYLCGQSIQEVFPEDVDLVMMAAESYLGVALKNDRGESIGNLCIFDTKPVLPEQLAVARQILGVFAARASAELQRKKLLTQLNQELEARGEQREIRYQSLMEYAPDAILLATSDGYIVEANRKAEDMFGYALPELTTLHFTQLHPPEELPKVMTIFAAIAANQLTQAADILFLRRDGTTLPVDVTASIIQLKDEVLIQGIFRDITDRKQAERALRESQQLLQTVLDTVPLSVFWKDRTSCYLGANQRFLQDASLSAVSELVGKNDFDMPWGATEADLYRTDDRDVMNSGEAKLGIIETQSNQDGKLIWLETNKLPLRNLSGEVVGVLGTYQDITARRRAEQELQLQWTAIEAAVDGIAVLQSERYLYLNSSHVKMFGYGNAEELVGQSWRVLYSPEEQEHFDRDVFPILLAQKFWQGEVTATRKDGTTFAERVSLTITPDNLLICVCQDISERARLEVERQRAERALRESEQRYATLTQAAPVAIFRFDLEGHCVYVNEFWSQMTGKPVAFALDNRWLETLHPDDREHTQTLVQQWIQAGAATLFQNEARILHDDGRIVWFYCQMLLEANSNGEPIGYVGTLTDISDRVAAEMLVRQQAQRETLLREITQRVRQSLDLQTIFETACHEVRLGLQSDRVGIFKFYPDSHWNDGEFVAESVAEGFVSALAIRVHDHCFGEDYAPLYLQGSYSAIEDIDQLKSQCHIDVLAQFQVRATLTMPLLEGDNLWGLLCIHQCSETRQWLPSEVDLTQQIASQLAIAIQQANLYAKAQSELQERQQAEAKIALQLRRQQTLATITQLLQQSFDLEHIQTIITHQVKDVLQADRVIIFRLYPDGTSRIVEEAVVEGLPRLRDKHWEDEVWSQEILDLYWQGQPRIVPDVMTDRWTDCLIEYSIEGQIQSKIVAPILQELRHDDNHRWVSTTAANKLWGVLVVHACTQKRVWQETEAQLLQQIANQVAIAIQQSDLFNQLEQELIERKQAQNQLTESNQRLSVTNTELARATRLKDEFLANMSHELRTPLNAILGMTEGLQEEVFGIVNDRQLKALRTVEKSASHLLSLINDILDVAKIESGQVTLEYSKVSVKQLCSSSLSFVKQQAFKKNIQLHTEIPPNLEPLSVDEVRMRQVLINLLTNAVKFTLEGGTINLNVSLLLQENTSPNYLRIAVTDTGIGISPENRAKLFKPFVQIDGALNRKQTGTGLGLALVKQIVELHGGKVGLSSELGVGSCFTIDLPYAPQINLSNQAGSLPLDRESTPPLTNVPTFDQPPLVLLAEDNPDNVATISSYLEAKGYRILLANNGREAIDLSISHQPDVILMDIQMPDLDGLEAMGQIRQQSSLQDTPIIALTALAMKGDRERCLATGANYYLSKPVKLKQLDNLLKEILADGDRQA